MAAGFPGASGPGLDVVLRPRESDSDSFFFVVVTKSDAEAAEEFSSYVPMSGGHTYDARSGNVVVIADEGVTPSVRARLEAVLADLAD